MDITPTIAILSGFNTNDLTSVLLDLTHLSIIAMNNFKINNIYILTDDIVKFALFYKKETIRLGIINSFDKLKVISIHNNIEYITKLTELFNLYSTQQFLFTISCHGYTGLRSTNKSDLSGLNDYIVINGTKIIDDDLFNIVSKLDEKTIILSLVDTCSSGTMMDLPYVLDIKADRYYEENKLVCSPVIHMFSACKDSEFDSDSISDKFGYSGGLSSIFLDYIDDKNTINVVELVKFIKEKDPANSLFSSSRKIDFNKID